MMNAANAAGSNEDYKHDIFDKWIISRFNHTIKTYIQALESYRINEASKALYDFVWSEFCDWYIEILKIKALHNSRASGKIFNDAINLFEGALKLLHPVMPFISEELWCGLQEGREGKSISVEEMPPLNESLISNNIEHDIFEIQNLISAIRNLRAEVNLSPSVKCEVAISCSTKESNYVLSSVKNYVLSLAKIEKADVGINLPKPAYKHISSVVSGYQVYLKIEGIIDVEKERERTKKEIERAEGFLISINKKLENEKFVSKASPEIVENEKKKREDTKEKLEKLRSHYNSLAG
jgi:valyl-tRNA synthetase